MDKKILAVLAAFLISLTVSIQQIGFTSSAEKNDFDPFSISLYIENILSEKAEISEDDISQFDRFLKYSLCVADKSTLSPEELNLCKTIFATERSYMPYIQCPYARELIRNGYAPKRISLEDKRLIADMANPYISTVELSMLIPDIVYTDSANECEIYEYWLDDNGKERIITSSGSDAPCYQISYDEMPEPSEFDRVVEICWGGGNLIESNNGGFFYVGGMDGSRYSEYLIRNVYTSDIWNYEIMEDGSAIITDCTLPKFDQAKQITETLTLPTELDGHTVYGIEKALMGTGVTKLVIPDTYQYVRLFFGMEYLKEVVVDATDLTLHSACFASCPNLETVVLNVKFIEEKAFINCDNLKSVEIVGAKGIEHDAFSELPALSKVTLPNNLQYIGQDAFCSTAVLELVIPKNVTVSGVMKLPYTSNGKTVDPLNADNIKIADDDCIIKGYYITESHYYAIANGFQFSPLDEITYGDVNADGIFSISDVVLLQKWLLADRDVVLLNWEYADFCADGILNVYDLCLMKRSLVN